MNEVRVCPTCGASIVGEASTLDQSMGTLPAVKWACRSLDGWQSHWTRWERI